MMHICFLLHDLTDIFYKQIRFYDCLPVSPFCSVLSIHFQNLFRAHVLVPDKRFSRDPSRKGSSQSHELFPECIT